MRGLCTSAYVCRGVFSRNARVFVSYVFVKLLKYVFCEFCDSICFISVSVIGELSLMISMSVLERRCVFCGFHCGLSVHAIVYGSGRWVFRWGAGLSVAPRWFIGQLFYVWDKRLWRRINEFIGNKCIYSGLSKMRFGTKWQWNCDFLVSQSRENVQFHL